MCATASRHVLREQASECWVTATDGQRPVRHGRLAAVGRKGEPQGLLGISRNITERRRHEEEIRRAKETAEKLRG
jgi:hypothetical protein